MYQRGFNVTCGFLLPLFLPMKRLLLTIILSLATILNITAQDSLLIETLSKNTHPLQFEKGQFSGVGYEMLVEAGQENVFFLIGENHGFIENPKITTSLFKAFQPLGYKYFATETGPFTARFLQEKTSGDLYSNMQVFFNQYPWSIPFYSWKEECEILEAVVSQSTSTEALIWGLDQEFAASFRMHFDYLYKNASTDASRQLAMKYLEKAVDGLEDARTTRNPAKFFMASARPDDFAQLKSAFKGQEDHLKRIQELEESVHIYQLWFVGQGYASNQLRAKMMKKHFMEYYDKAKEKNTQPKVMFKFGANHMYKGASRLNIYDIGNLVHELAEMEGSTSFHLYTLGLTGTQCAYTPFSQSEADKEKPYDITSPDSDNEYAVLLRAISKDSWSLVDLRPLRKALFNHELKDVHSDFEKLIWSYDAILIMPQVTASTPF